MMFRNFLVIGAMVLGQVACASAEEVTLHGAVDVYPEKTVYIKGEIDNLVPQVLEMRKIIQNGADDVTIVINSPGGSVDTTLFFMEAMDQAKLVGVKTRCIVDGIAASAAAVIFANCDEREATYGSYVLFHSAAVMGEFRLNMQDSAKLFQHLAEINLKLWLQTSTHFSDEFFGQAFQEERLIPVTECAANSETYLKVVRKINVIKEGD